MESSGPNTMDIRLSDGEQLDYAIALSLSNEEYNDSCVTAHSSVPIVVIDDK